MASGRASGLVLSFCVEGVSVSITYKVCGRLTRVADGCGAISAVAASPLQVNQSIKTQDQLGQWPNKPRP